MNDQKEQLKLVTVRISPSLQDKVKEKCHERKISFQSFVAIALSNECNN
jgi:predicted DNA binding CopG/RHH family protein